MADKFHDLTYNFKLSLGIFLCCISLPLFFFCTSECMFEFFSTPQKGYKDMMHVLLCVF